MGQTVRRPLRTNNVRTKWTATLVAPRWSAFRPTGRSTDPRGSVSTNPAGCKRAELKACSPPGSARPERRWAMKLARTNHILTHVLSRGSGNGRRMTRLVSTRAFSLQRHQSRLVARWHVCPETHRLECSWSLEPLACEDQLCRSRSKRRRHGQTR